MDGIAIRKGTVLTHFGPDITFPFVYFGVKHPVKLSSFVRFFYKKICRQFSETKGLTIAVHQRRFFPLAQEEKATSD